MSKPSNISYKLRNKLLRRIALICCMYILIFNSNGFSQKNKNSTALISSGSAKFLNQPSDTLLLEQTPEWVIVEMKIGGNLKKFIWDTGSAYSSIDQPDTVNFRRIPLSDFYFVDAVGVKQKSELYIARSVTIGSTDFKDITFMSLDTKKMASGVTKDYAGVIGLDIIDKVNWYFDWDKNQIVISSKPFEIGNGREVRYANYLGYNTVRLNAFLPNGKRLNTAVLVDFGVAGNSIYLSAENLDKFRTMKAALTKGFQGVGISGNGGLQHVYQLAEPLACTIGISGKNMRIKPLISIGTSNRQSVIGNHFFRQYNFARNSLQSVFMFFDRKTKLEGDKYRGLSYGVSLGINEKNEIYVNALTKNPNVDNTSLAIGDVVKYVNGNDASKFQNMIDLKNYLQKCIGNNSILRLGTTSGSEYELYPKKNEMIVIN